MVLRRGFAVMKLKSGCKALMIHADLYDACQQSGVPTFVLETTRKDPCLPADSTERWCKIQRINERTNVPVKVRQKMLRISLSYRKLPRVVVVDIKIVVPSVRNPPGGRNVPLRSLANQLRLKAGSSSTLRYHDSFLPPPAKTRVALVCCSRFLNCHGGSSPERSQFPFVCSERRR